MFNFLKKDSAEVFRKKNLKTIEAINKLEPEIEKLSDFSLREKSLKLKEQIKNPSDLDNFLVEGFALIREAAKRQLGQRHFDSQMFGGLAIHQGKITEMKTGEGKTLSATAPVYLNALLGRGVHIVTVNDYLAKRDAVWMGQIYYALGLSVSCIVSGAAFIYDPSANGNSDEERDKKGFFQIEDSYLRQVERKEAYQADITYGANHEFGFDYLRDNLVYKLEDKVQRGRFFAIVDEVDSILIDEARTPLIITFPEKESSKYYSLFSQIAPQLKKDEDYEVDEKYRSVSINESGISKVEKILGIDNLYSQSGFRYIHYLEESLKAFAIFKKDKDYVVKNNEVLIVDEFTGRILAGRRYSGGLHQALEAKEKVPVRQENRIMASITYQNYFRSYEKLSGMTGTALTSAEEFDKVYGLEAVAIPTNKPIIRKDLPDLIYKTEKEKWSAIIEEIREKNEKGQPILVGTASIEKNEKLSGFLSRVGIEHNLLNAKNHEKEAGIIAQAGKRGSITIATNMAGRGVDIVLGGSNSSPEEGDKIRKLGGLAVIATDRHEARRIDNQLRGRAGRMGDPGESRFFVSLEDDLMRIFGGEKLKGMMERFNYPEGEPIESKFISKAIESAQSKVEGMHFDVRKHTLEYDDVLNKHRTSFYKKRNEVLESSNLEEYTHQIIKKNLEKFADVPSEELNRVLSELEIDSPQNFDSKFQKIKTNIGSDLFEPTLKSLILRILDSLWTEHLEDMDHLRDSVRLRAYGHHDPLVEYRNGGKKLFDEFFMRFEAILFENFFRLKKPELSISSHQPKVPANKPPSSLSKSNSSNSKIGRNDQCPCGSGKKYKKCCGF